MQTETQEEICQSLANDEIFDSLCVVTRTSEEATVIQQGISAVSINAAQPIDTNLNIEVQTQSCECTSCSVEPYVSPPKKSILKKESSFPKSPSSEDVFPVRLRIHGSEVELTIDKYGKVIPFEHSFWFANRRYDLKALQARRVHASIRQIRTQEALARQQANKETHIAARRGTHQT
jgi:hypothetical protein